MIGPAERHLSLLDAALPGRITGYYLTGSAALNDYVEKTSDLDFVCVAESPFSMDEILRLKGIHARIAEEKGLPSFDGIYVTRGQLTQSTTGLSVPRALDGALEKADSYAANPITWYTLKAHPMAVRPLKGLEVFHDDAEMRQWCRDNLESYWRPWIARGQSPLQGWALLFPGQISWGVLGIVRLHATIQDGVILSKSQAAEYAVRTFGTEWNSIVVEALAHRVGNGSHYLSAFQRRRDALDFMEMVLKQNKHR